eukprot:1184916-Prorocentrum_minimum.AAC.5
MGEEPNFEIDPAVVEYQGDPDDRKALLGHRKWLECVPVRTFDNFVLLSGWKGEYRTDPRAQADTLFAHRPKSPPPPLVECQPLWTPCGPPLDPL